MIKKTIPNILFLVLVNLLVKPFWVFGIDRVVQNQLGEATFGAYFALFNFSMLFQILNDFGIQNFNSRDIAREPHLLRSYLPNLIAGKALLSGIYFIVTIAVFLLLGYSFPESGKILVLLLLNQVLISYIFYMRSNLAGLHKFKLDAIFSILDKVLMIIMAGSILYFNLFQIPLNITNFILSQTIAFAINALFLTMVVGKLSALRTFQPDPGLIGRIMKESFPFAMSVFLMSIYLRMDAIMVERMLGSNGPYETGIYAQSFRIIDALNMIGILFANILLPTYARQLEHHQDSSSTIKNAGFLMALFVIPVTLTVLFGGQHIIELLYVNDPAYSGSIFTILILSFAAYSFMHVFSSYLTAAGRLRQLNIVFGVGIILNFISNLILIPKMGAKGAALTTTCSEWIVLVVIVVLCLKFLRQSTIENQRQATTV
ncbi:MAG: oligosaccharide flippase family protein [Bacteroidetes bacterium]|nr:oligosaccharide flippase family protein [Bacteroidota bacterium]